jgi:hypothetical protein
MALNMAWCTPALLSLANPLARFIGVYITVQLKIEYKNSEYNGFSKLMDKGNHCAIFPIISGKIQFEKGIHKQFLKFSGFYLIFIFAHLKLAG